MDKLTVEFERKYNLVSEEIFCTLDELFINIKSKGMDKYNAWTILDSNTGNGLCLVPSVWKINSVGYILTNEKWTDDEQYDSYEW